MTVEITFNALFGSTLRYYYQRRNVRKKVLTLPLMLDFGDIRDGGLVKTRTSLLRGLHQNLRGYNVAEEVQEITDHLAFLKILIQEGETFRVWWTETAADYCGFLWLCQQLSKTGNRLNQVKMPLVFPKRDALVQITNLGEIIYSDIDELMSYAIQQEVPKYVQRDYGYNWRDVKDENQPIRALINEHLVSQPVTFYDQFIYQQLSDGEFIELTKMIGRLALNADFGISSTWYLYRIELLISDGQLEAKRGQSSSPLKTLIRLKE